MLFVVGFFEFDCIALTSISYCFQDVLGVGMHCVSSACPMSLEQDGRRSWRTFNDGRSDEPCKQYISLVSLLTLLLSSSISLFRIFWITASVNILIIIRKFFRETMSFILHFLRPRGAFRALTPEARNSFVATTIGLGMASFEFGHTMGRLYQLPSLKPNPSPKQQSDPVQETEQSVRRVGKK
jgi:hypothetical protein